MEVTTVVTLSAQIVEAAGVATMVGGMLVAVLMTLARRTLAAPRGAYREFRQRVGKAILLGLEFLVAADIIRTVSERPTLTGVLILAGVVAIRTFLSFTLELELEGRWPWQRRPGSDASQTGPRAAERTSVPPTGDS